MNFSFDYYHNLERVDFYLCNPDETELFPIIGENRHFTLRFNDLSELTFDIYPTVLNASGSTVYVEAYDYIQTPRLVLVPQIGWFRISSVDEVDDGMMKYKQVTAESYQAVFKNRGFVAEDRVYCFYNPNDPHDDLYNASDEGAIPSVVGQLYRQLGIEVDLFVDASALTEPMSNWTITDISDELLSLDSDAAHRTFKEGTTYGYDWMVKDVEDAFGVVVLFDFRYKTIQVKMPGEVGEDSGAILSFANIMKSIHVTESADNIVTVLNCSGDNCDIRCVNPTGTNYICDFSYFMDEENHRWMSQKLIDKLTEWAAECEKKSEEYANYSQLYYEANLLKEQNEEQLELFSLRLQDLKNAEANRDKLKDTEPCGIVCAESVHINERSLLPSSYFYHNDFTDASYITAYTDAPAFEHSEVGWHFAGTHLYGSVSSIVDEFVSNGARYLYFADGTNNESYCKLIIKTSVDKDKNQTVYCDGFERYIAYTKPLDASGLGEVQYGDMLTLNIGGVATRYATVEDDITVDVVNDNGVMCWFSDELYIDQPTLADGERCVLVDVDATANCNMITTMDVGSCVIESCRVGPFDLNGVLPSGDVISNVVVDLRNYFTGESYDAIAEFGADNVMWINVTSVSSSDMIPCVCSVTIQHSPQVLLCTADVQDGDSATVLLQVTTTRKVYGFRVSLVAQYNITYPSNEQYSFTNLVQKWIAIYEHKVSGYNAKISEHQADIDKYDAYLNQIASELNILNYVSKDPELLRELTSYWIEGDYKDDNISVSADATISEEIELSKELLRVGEIELQKMCQPRFSFTLDAADILSSYEYEYWLHALDLGKMVNVEKQEGLWYYPVLLEMAFNLDSHDEFSMTFANALRLDDWGYTYADLISQSASTSRQISANWQNIMNYAKDKETIGDLLKNPLDATLRASFANMTNQEFTIDSNGILGRKKISDSVFADEQLRMTNNVLLFTNDNWKTAKTALGKITYQDDSGQWVTAYGLIADTIIGSLVMSEALKIRSKDGFVELGSNGITIKNQNGVEVFRATTNGSVYISPDSGYGDPDIDGDGALSEQELFNMINGSTNAIVLGAGKLSIVSTNFSVDQGGNVTMRGLLRFNDGYYINTNPDMGSLAYYIYLPRFTLDNRGNATFSGSLNAAEGTFKGELQAAKGTFGTGAKVFSIGSSSGFGCTSSAIWSGSSAFSGSCGHGQIQDNSVYIGGDGFSYHSGDAYYSYNTSIRPAVVCCSGSPSANGVYNAVLYKLNGVQFYRGLSDLRNEACAIGGGYYIADMSIDGDSVKLGGNWVGKAGMPIDSDASLKNSVATYASAYDTLFDALKPVTYKYNNGTSGRTHTGFIAQDVLASIEAAGLTTKDFAAYIESTDESGEITRSLRYEEFISMNTWQIQKLKQRVSALEQELARLKEV